MIAQFPAPLTRVLELLTQVRIQPGDGDRLGEGFKALRAGASGFLGKGVSPEILLAGIRTVAAGEALLSPTARQALITRFLATPDTDGFLALHHAVKALTDHEREVVTLAAHGKSNTEIADKLVVSPLTVRSHIHRAMTKLNARDRAQLVVIAYQSGLVKPHPHG